MMASTSFMATAYARRGVRATHVRPIPVTLAEVVRGVRDTQAGGGGWRLGQGTTGTARERRPPSHIARWRWTPRRYTPLVSVVHPIAAAGLSCDLAQPATAHEEANESAPGLVS